MRRTYIIRFIHQIIKNKIHLLCKFADLNDSIYTIIYYYCLITMFGFCFLVLFRINFFQHRNIHSTFTVRPFCYFTFFFYIETNARATSIPSKCFEKKCVYFLLLVLALKKKNNLSFVLHTQLGL